MTISGNTFSFTLPGDRNIDPNNLPKGVTFDSTTGTVSIDTTEADTFGVYESYGSTLFGIDYSAYASDPKLPKPDDNPSDAPKPYGAAEQFLVRQVFTQNAQTLLNESGISNQDAVKILRYIVTGDGASLTPNERLIGDNIKSQATILTQSQVGLPKTWNMSSADAASWTPIPPQPYNDLEQTAINQYFDDQLSGATDSYVSLANPPLNQEQISALKSAVQAGVVPMPDTLGIKGAYESIQKSATELTQAEFGLPDTWFRGTEPTNVANWTPVNLNPITGARITIVRSEILADNMQSMVDGLTSLIQKHVDGLPKDDQMGKELGPLLEFLKVVGDTIRELKAALKQVQRADAEQSQRTTRAKFDAIDQRSKELDDQFAKDKEAAQKEKKSRDTNLAMKILGPIITAVTTIIGILISVATLGLASPLGVALVALGIGLGAAMIAYTIADSVTGCSTKFIEAFKGWLDDVVKNIQPESLAKFVKGVIVSAIVAPLAVLLIVCIATGSGLGTVANAATMTAAAVAIQTTINVGKQLILKGIQQVIIQLLMTLLMGSNAIPEIVGSIAKAAGASKEVQMALEITMMVIMTLMIVVAIAKGAKLGGKIVEGVEKAANSSAMSGAKAAAQAVKDQINGALDRLGNLIMDIGKKIPAEVKQYLEIFQKAAKNLNNLQMWEKAFTVAGFVANMAGGIANGVILIKLYQIQKESGEIEAAEQMLTELIKLFQKLISNLLNGISSQGEFIDTLNKFFNSMYSAADQNIGKLFAHSQAI